MKITLFIPCFVDQFYPQAGMSLVKIFERLGHTVDFPEGQTCCGQPPFNSGYWDEARAVAERQMAVFRDAETVVICSGSCGAMVKVFYPELFHGHPREAEAKALAAKTFEFSEFLVHKLGVLDVGARFPGRATFHDGCHGLRELGIKKPPRQLLEHVRGLKLVEMKEAETCCGFGGTFAVKFPMISTAMGEVKCASIAETGADFVISNDSSCLMQIRGILDKQGNPVKTFHLAEVPRPNMNTQAREFSEDARRQTGDLQHRALIQKALSGYYVKRDENKARFQSWSGARNAAAQIKWDAVNHLDRYLEEFASKLEARGTKIFWASDARDARDYVVRLAREQKVRSIIKSKSMTAEEIHLNDTLEKEGFDVVESDLGEYIVQLRREPPYHLVFPAMHLTRGQISDLFHDKLGSAPTNNPEDLTMIAREIMRRKFCAADMGITGANFAVAETGMICITENEGNARLTAALPKIHVAIVGIEKILPKLSDLALFLPMLGTAGAGQLLTCYNSLYAGPRLPGEPDGPREFHVVLLDNRRTQLLADAEQRDALHCIRCGACLNVCPIFKNVGGHSYGTTYQGPIGSVITPHLRGLQEWKHLSLASSLCGACTEACPVKINLHHHLLHNRRNAATAKPSWSEKILYGLFAFTMRRPRVYQLATELARLAQPLRVAVNGTLLDPLRPWTKTRSFPPVAAKTFRDLWREKSSASGMSVENLETRAELSKSESHFFAVPSPLPSDGRGEGQGEVRGTPPSQRQSILARIREALKISAPHPVADPPPSGSPQQWLPSVGPSLDDQIELFRQNAQNLKADFRVCASLDDAIQFLKTLAASEGWKKIALHRGDLTTPAAHALDLPRVETDAGYATDDLESCQVGLTECEALVAQTGSVLVSATGSGGRALSVLPPHHVVLARRSQMLPDLTAALRHVSGKFKGNFPGFMSFITGSSRTGDIERILVLGAHGPKKLTILLLP